VYLADVVAKQAKHILTKISQNKTRTEDGRRGAYESPKPNVAFAWLRVIWREIFDTFL
jgi:hypothetical protein